MRLRATIAPHHGHFAATSDRWHPGLAVPAIAAMSAVSWWLIWRIGNTVYGFIS